MSICYRHHNLNEYKGWIERITRAAVELPPISDDILKETAELHFCDKGHAGTATFGNRGNAQTGYPGCGIIFGMFPSQYYIFVIVSPLEIAFEVLPRKVSDMRPNSESCQLQLVSTCNINQDKPFFRALHSLILQENKASLWVEM